MRAALAGGQPVLPPGKVFWLGGWVMQMSSSLTLVVVFEGKLHFFRL